MGNSFKRAVKEQSFLRLALAGPAGSGKTYSALALASALADGKPVAVVDTEHGSASKYADLFAFDVLELDRFHPDRYIEAIRDADAAGYAVLVIDSLTHAWEGAGGLLEIVGEIAKRKYGGNTFAAWAEGTPIQTRLIEAIIGNRMHIIATMRTKSDYATDKDERGKLTVQKVGTAVKQRDGVEYEFDIFGKLTLDNDLIVEKSRCPALSGKVISKPGAQMAATLRTWLSGAVPTPKPAPASQPLPDAASNGNGHHAAAAAPKPAAKPAPIAAAQPAYRIGSNADDIDRFRALGLTTPNAVKDYLRSKGVDLEHLTRGAVVAALDAAESDHRETGELPLTDDGASDDAAYDLHDLGTVAGVN